MNIAPVRFVRHLATAAVIAAVVVGVAWLAPSLWGFDRYVITGKSMTGTVDRGSVVFTKPRAVADLRVGDIVTYLPPEDSGTHSLVTHRIVAVGEVKGVTVLRTKGDANPDPDPWKFRLDAQTVPVTEFSVPHVGWVLIAFADPTVRRVVVGIPATAIALLAARDLIRALIRARRERRTARLLRKSPCPAPTR